jgi:DNA-binding transcriptional regulator YdaS (Cro superfamily)
MGKNGAAIPLTHAMVVEKLGDRIVIARALGMDKPNTVAHWKRKGRGIPPHYWPAIERLAAAQGLRITCADLEASSPIQFLRRKLASPRREA